MKWLATALLLIPAPKDPSVDDLMKSLRAKVDGARTIKVEYDVQFGFGRLQTRGKGLVRIKGDRWTSELRFKRAENPAHDLACDGLRILNRGGTPLPIQDFKPADAARELRGMLATGIASTAFFASRGEKPRPAKVTAYADLGKKTLDGTEVRVVGCNARFNWGDWHEGQEEMRISVDPKGLCLRRVEAESERFQCVLSFSAWAYDAEIADSEFALESPDALARAQAEQLARSAELFGQFAGRAARSLDELVRRPPDLPADVLWPEGGFVLGAVPKDFELAAGRVVWRKGDVAAAVPPSPRQAVAAPTERLKQHYTARVRLHLLAAAVRAYHKAYAQLPKKRSDLWEKPAEIASWPEGGWLPGGKLPDDPWGQPFRMITDAAAVRIQVQDPKARVLRASQLTKEETAALEAGARPRLAEAETKALVGLMAGLTDDDLETRQESNRRLSEFGLAARPFLEERIRSEKSPDGREWLRRSLESMPTRPPPWQAELASLSTVVGTAPAGAAAANERNASATLKTLATAQADFRANDRDGNRIQDFWTGDVAGLYCVVTLGGGDQPNKLIELATAAADAAPLTPPAGGAAYPKGIETFAVRGPKAGYHFQAMTRDRSANEPYAEGADKLHCNSRFGFCAFPAEYGVTGTRTYILNEGNTMFWKDSGGEPVLEWPTDEELKAEWRKLD